MKLLLDTSAFSGMMRGHEGIVEIIRRSERIVFSPIVVGELLHGFRCGSRFEANESALRSFLDNPYVDVLSVTMNTADRFARIAAALRRKGTPIPTNDIWIAAQALESGADLLSLDQHFNHVDGLVALYP